MIVIFLGVVVNPQPNHDFDDHIHSEHIATINTSFTLATLSLYFSTLNANFVYNLVFCYVTRIIFMSEKLKRKIIYSVTSSIRKNIRAFIRGLPLQRQMTMVNSNSRKDKESHIIETKTNYSNKIKAETTIKDTMEEVDETMETEVAGNLSKRSSSTSHRSSTRINTSTNFKPNTTVSKGKTDKGEKEASINTESTYSTDHTLDISNRLIESFEDDDGNTHFLMQDGSNYKDADENRSYYGVQLSTTLNDYDKSMMTTEEHEEENDNVEVLNNNISTWSGNSKAGWTSST